MKKISVEFATPASSHVANTWQHIALVRSSGNWKIFVDGVDQTLTFSNGSQGDAPNIQNFGTAPRIGYSFSGSHWYLDGYIDDLRVSDMARYTSDFVLADVTLPTDKKGTHTLTLNGDALITPSGSGENTKFGTGAMRFDGGDYITISGI